MESQEHLDALCDAGRAFATRLAGAPWRAAVPTCPGWDVQALARHLGKVHRWAATIVGTPLHQALPFVSFDAQAPESTRDLVPWYEEGLAGLLGALREAPPNLDCWRFLRAPSPRAFWCRRQAHETAMHLVDLVVALGPRADSPEGAAKRVLPDPTGWEPSPAFAADGIDELVWGWMRGRRPESAEEREPALRVIGTDHDLDWGLRFPGPRGVVVVGGSEIARAAACTVRGRAVDLYLLLWNRSPAGALDVEGDVTVLDRWAAARRV